MSPAPDLELILVELALLEALLFINVELCLSVATAIDDVLDEDSNGGEDGGLC